MQNISPEKLQVWKKKRTRTFIAFTLVDGILGMEYSMIMPTIYLYLTTLINSSHPMFFYGIIPASFYIANILSGVIFGRISDRTRKIWFLHQCGNFLILMGNLIYAFHFSSLFPLAGRILAGMGAGLRAVIYGEIGRIFDAKEMSRYIAITCVGCMVGYVVGPLINIFFKDIDFYIGSWHINYTNMPGVYMAVMCLVNQIILFFMVHDLSAEHEFSNESTEDSPLLEKSEDFMENKFLDGEMSSETESVESSRCTESLNCSLKHVPAETDMSDENQKSTNSKYSLPSQTFIWRKLFSSIDCVLLMTTTFVFGFTVLASDMWYPLIVIKELKWGVTAINGVLIENGVIMIPMLVLIVLKPLSNKLVFISYIVTIILQIIVFLILLLLRDYHPNYALNVALLGTYGVCYSVTAYMHQLPCVTLSLMTPKSSQGYVQGIHQAFFRVGAALGLFIPPLVYSWFTIDVIFIAALATVLLFAIVVRRKNIIDPKLLF